MRRRFFFGICLLGLLDMVVCRIALSGSIFYRWHLGMEARGADCASAQMVKKSPTFFKIGEV